VLVDNGHLQRTPTQPGEIHRGHHAAKTTTDDGNAVESGNRHGISKKRNFGKNNLSAGAFQAFNAILEYIRSVRP
jgi:hypothetical protein